MSRTPEGIEKAKVKAFLASIKAYAYWPVPSGYGKQGVDCYACIRGRFWAIEVKAPGGLPTPRQNLTLDEVANASGHTITGTGDKIVAYITAVLRSEKQSVGL